MAKHCLINQKNQTFHTLTDCQSFTFIYADNSAHNSHSEVKYKRDLIQTNNIHF